MKKTIIFLAALLPLIAFAQTEFDYLHKDDYHDLIGWIIAFYCLGCFIVAGICSYRGWDGLGVFAAAVFLSPLIAAILYAPYKKEKLDGPETAEGLSELKKANTELENAG